MALFLSISLSICLCYSLLVLSFWRGWRSLKPHPEQNAGLPRVSLIVPYRNEENKILSLLENLKQINYPKELKEVILVNDHSDDSGPEIIQGFMNANPGFGSAYSLEANLKGKKAALRLGASRAQGEILLLTDADCRFGPDWVISMMQAFSNPDIQMTQGPVVIDPADNWVGNIQQIEFLSLMMSAAGSAGLFHPVLASGANLAVRKEVYLKATSYLKDHINTGDDMFLLEYLKKRYPAGVAFLKNSKAIIQTPAVNSFQQFWNQRKRWTSKSTHYQNFEIMGTAMLVFFTNAILLITLIFALINLHWILLPISLLVLKTISEWPLMESGLKFYGLRNKRKWFFLFELVYPVYVLAISLAGVFGSFSWKSRKR